MGEIKEFLKRFIPISRKNYQEKMNQLSNEIELLKKRVDNLNTERENSIKNKVDPLQKIINSYRGNIWNLKNIIRDMEPGEDKNLYLRAYYAILNEKGSWIGVDSKFASIPTFPHNYMGIFVSNGAVIGKNAVIFQHVTIGSNSLDDSRQKGSPTIGDNVYIGAGAKIIGKITIGNNCRIGANAVVAIDIPDDSVVVMDKPRVIHKDGMDNKFYNYQNGQYGYHLEGKFYPVNDCER